MSNPEAQYLSREAEANLALLVACLPQPHRAVAEALLLPDDPPTQEQVAERLGICQQYVSRLLSEASPMLRKLAARSGLLLHLSQEEKEV